MSRDYLLQPVSGQPLQIRYEEVLNPQQLAAVTAPPGPALVIAGAGAGKTRTLIYRVAYLLEQGIPPERILLLTFTNKAAREMMRRVADLLGGDTRTLWGGTFHSVAHRFLRQYAGSIGYRPDFTILDREDARELLAACVGELEFDTTKTLFPKPEVLADLFSRAANTGTAVEQVVEAEYPDLKPVLDPIQKVQSVFAGRKRRSQVMDFDDLLLHWLQLLTEHPQVREEIQRRFQFVLVDEYQDTNTLQGRLVDLMAERHQNLMVVGDDAQSIYSWRGANFRNILEFPKRYPRAVVYPIETNYRSSPEILQVANAVIAGNQQQFPKVLAASRPSGMRPALVPCVDAGVQAAFVAQRVLELRDEGVSLGRMAVLYRSHFHAMELQLHLTRAGIPFTITSGIRFFEQAHIKDVAAWLKLVSNPQDELAFKRLVQLFRGIGARSASRLWTAYLEKQAAGGGTSAGPLAGALHAISGEVPRKAAVDWAQFLATAAQLQGLENKPGPRIRLVLEAGYEEYLEAAYPNYRARIEDLEQLALFADQYESTEEFLAQMALMTNLEAEEQRPVREEEMLRLSTIHQAKGLEFDVVFVIMLCDGLFPSKRSLDTGDMEEEERRLFYVAITRARDELYLLYPLVRFVAGTGADYRQQISRFLLEIPSELMEEWNLKGGMAGGELF